MKPNLIDSLRRGDRFWLMDGAMGTQLQKRGMPAGAKPELLNLTHPEMVTAVHRDYLAAGAEILYTNTFGANRRKLASCGYSPKEVIFAAVQNARAAGGDALVALDIGPIGELLEPTGTLRFEDAYTLFQEQAAAGIAAGVDLIVVETMTDLYEVKAAILAVKETCEQLGKPLPLLVSMTFEANGRTFTGCCIPSMAAVIEGLGADAIGFNCSLGPQELLALTRQLWESTSLPIFLKPNAGLPDPQTGHYHISPEIFAQTLEDYLPLGIHLFGGCCGTDPSFLAAVHRMLSHHTPSPNPARPPRIPCVCTPTTFVPIDRVRVIGERINPTGKPQMKQAVLTEDFDYILRQGIEQVEAGADILDVNVGVPGVAETTLLPLTVKKLQSVLDAPLQLDCSNPAAIEQALRVCNGKPIVNSVNGEERSMETILPLVKKYGAAVVALTLDENGIPLSAKERFAIAERIVNRALSYGIAREDVFVDCLTLTVSAQQAEVVETLRALRMVRERLGVRTVLGVSNISFGLPNRELLNHSFLLMALQAGLDLPILNPNTASMMDAIRAFEVLYNQDRRAERYIAHFQAHPEQVPTVCSAPPPKAVSLPDGLGKAVYQGLGEEVRRQVSLLLEHQPPQAVINEQLIPALDRVGQDFESGTLFLPQMIQSAQAAQAGFAVIRQFLKAHPQQETTTDAADRRIILATVQGDVHDIGKNIVRVILENYGYPVIDLGKDVAPEAVVEAIERHQVRLVGLSALMTTTLHSMERTIAAIRARGLDCRIMVGGAVLTEDYAKKIGADFYAKDAKASADIAREILG